MGRVGGREGKWGQEGVGRVVGRGGRVSWGRRVSGGGREGKWGREGWRVVVREGGRVSGGGW